MTLKKRPLIWLVLTAMIFSLFPPGLFGSNVASAASQAPATYFIPDLKSISDTSLLSTEPSTANSTQIARGNVYMTTSPNLTITGTFSYVSKDTMRVKVEQLSSVAVGSQGQVRWVTDDTHFTSGAVTTDANASNKFTATNLNLFSGFNKITFYGNQGNVERSDTFYVLYDKVPFVEDLKVFSGNNSFNLNEGAQVVVNTQAVAVQGKAQNATKVTVSVNGGTALLSSLLEDGTFFTPQMNLSSGLNNLKFSITNASDTINIERSIYYFDTNQPFSKLDVVSDTETKSLLSSTQTVSTPGNPAGTAFLNGEVLLPYNASNQDFATTAQMTINTTAVNFTVLSNTVVAGNDGVTPAYRLVTFKTDNYNLQTDTNGIKNDQAANLVLTYGTFSAAYNGVFKYLPGDTVITNMYLLPDYNETNNTFSSKVPLNNSQVDKDSFYILVAANKAPTTTLEAHYLPLGTNPLSIVPVTPTTTIGANEQVYHVTNFASGQQQVRFKYNNASSSFNANISFVSKSYIYVSNLFDGQTYSFDSRTTHNLDVDGQYIGFTDLNNSMFNAQVFVNGVDQKPGDTSWITKSTGAFKLSFEIKKDGPLVFGENTIVLTGTDKDASGGTKEIRKELRIYILDTNVSNIDRFMPTLIPTNQRQAFSEKEVKNYTADQMSRIFSVTPDFAFQTDRYVTSEQEYDLVFKGGGAQIVNLYFGSKVILTYNPPAKGSETNGTASDPQSGYKYDFAGNEDEFIIRVQDLKFDAPGSHVYTLELINSTGARTTQRLEIVREPSSYRILAPQPTVGDKIVVNKNFVRFDIEAEGASQVIIDKKPAVKRTDLKDRFVYDYVGLKPNKNNAIKIQVVREGNTINDVINVFYTGTVEVDSQFMAPGPANKYSVFNKQLELSFPKGTILQSSSQVGSGVVKFYPENKLLFGIADPKDGVVERRNDYGNIINVNPDSRTEGGLSTIIIPDTLVLYFNSTLNTSNFSPVSDIYWINGGVGELGDQGSTGYKPGTNGLAPYSIEGNFTQYQAERKLVPSQRGTLKLTYDSNIVDEVGSTITVFRYTDKGVWQNIGGEVDTKKHTISVPFDEFGYYMVMKQTKGYSDVTNHPWGRNLLNALYSKGVMNSIRFNEFGADDQTTRGEFATLLVKGLSLPLNYDNKQTFYDIVPGAQSSTWDYASIETAARAGIVQGLSDGFFGADQRVTREQAAVMIARAMSLKLSANNDKLSANLGKSFMDAASIDFYARPAIEAVNKAKIMQGSPVTIAGAKKPLVQFNPKGNLTRAEAAKIAVELLKKTTKLFPKNLS